MNFRKGKSREDPEINLIPFIDVLLVILIFLMVSTTYSKLTALHVTLPTASANKAQDHPFELNVGIDTRGNYAINDVRVAVREPAGLAEELKNAMLDKRANGKDPVVIINADAAAAHQSVINVLEAARLAGFDKVTFTAQTGSNK